MRLIPDPFFVFFAITAGIWLFRARRALHTLSNAPRILASGSIASGPGPEEQVSILIPAKNEEKNIRTCLESLLSQDYGSFEIIVINDNSTDRTEEILQSMNALHISDSHKKTPGSHPGAKLKYLNCPPTPEGWTGKNFALYQGARLAQGKWYLFTDADTRHHPSSLRQSMGYMRRHDLQLLTLLPRCLTGSMPEDLVQPSAMAFTGLWFPIEKINDPQSPLYFGNGQYILLRKDVYEHIGGHHHVRGEFLEDFALFKLVKETTKKAECAFGTEIYGTRMYDSITRMWRGWRRIFLYAFQRRPWLLLGRAASVFSFSVLPYLVFLPQSFLASRIPSQYGMGWGFAIVILVFILGTAWQAHGLVKAKRLYALGHPVSALFLTGVLLDAARMAWTGQKIHWR